MRIHHSVPFIALCLAGGVVLAGCAGPNGGASSTASPESPLEKYWSLLYGEQDQADIDRKNAEVQNKVAECMGEQGFDYVPDTHNGGVVMSDSSDLDWASEEFATTYGYGITTDPMGMGDGSDESLADPNADYVASLSASEQAAYNDALWGPAPPEVSADSAPVEYDWTTAGCNGEAQHEVFGEGGLGSDPETEALSEGMNSLYTEVRESPAVVEKERLWSDCLADAGFGAFDHKDDASAAISEAYGALFPAVQSSRGGSTETPSEGPDPQALKELQQKEIAQATADFDCARESGYTETLQKEQFRLEQAFVDEHREELDALVARAADGSK